MNKDPFPLEDMILPFYGGNIFKVWKRTKSVCGRESAKWAGEPKIMKPGIKASAVG